MLVDKNNVIYLPTFITVTNRRKYLSWKPSKDLTPVQCAASISQILRDTLSCACGIAKIVDHLPKTR